MVGVARVDIKLTIEHGHDGEVMLWRAVLKNMGKTPWMRYYDQASLEEDERQIRNLLAAVANEGIDYASQRS